MRCFACAIAVSIALPVAGEARACIGAQAQDTIIHTALPRPLPANTIVASVKFESRNLERLYSTGVRARVRRMLQGDYRGRYLIVRSPVRTSCDDPFGNGDAGRIVGIAQGMENGMLVIHPIMVSGLQRHRLPNGFQLAPRRPEGAEPRE